MRKLISFIVINLVCFSVYGADTRKISSSENSLDNYNKSMITLVSSICQLRTLEMNVIKNQADYLHKLMTIRELAEKVKTLQMANELKYAETFYAKKKLYEDNQKKKNTKGQEIQESLADKKVHPAALEIFKMDWPYPLTNEEFMAQRLQIEQLIEDRTLQNSGLGSNNYGNLHKLINELKELLKDNIDEYKPMEYITAKGFLEDLELEVRKVHTNLIASYKKSV